MVVGLSHHLNQFEVLSHPLIYSSPAARDSNLGWVGVDTSGGGVGMTTRRPPGARRPPAQLCVCHTETAVCVCHTETAVSVPHRDSYQLLLPTTATKYCYQVLLPSTATNYCYQLLLVIFSPKLLGWLACCAQPWLGLAWACLACLALDCSSNNNRPPAKQFRA